MGSEDWGQSSPTFPGFDLSLEQIIEKTARLVITTELMEFMVRSGFRTEAV